MRRLFPLMLVMTSLPAQEARLNGPTLGTAWHARTQTLRPLLGIFGAARFGDAYIFDGKIEFAEVAPGSKFALAVISKDSQRRAALLTWTDGVVSARELAGIPAEFSRVVFSPQARAAVLVSKTEVRTLTGLPDDPKLSAPVSLPDSDALAVDDSGAAAMVVRTSEEAVLYRVPFDQSPQRLYAAPAIQAAAFAREPDELYVAAGNSVGRISAEGAFTELSAQQRAEWLAADAKSLIAASSRGVMLAPRDGSASVQTPECACELSQLVLLSGDVYLLTGASSDLVWVLDSARRETRFVPAINTDEVTQ
ncbi:MAG: hypothetical protein ACKV22_12880 [Bryobacteraceae bacterium]